MDREQRLAYGQHLHFMDRLLGLDEKFANVPKHNYGA